MKRSAVEPLCPMELGSSKVPYAPGVRAGNWVFATGHMAQDRAGVLDDAVAARGLPHGGVPRSQKEAALIFERIEEVLQAGGSSLANIVRVDQYYPSSTAVDHYHIIRKKRLPTIPPSTSMLMQGLSVPEATINVQAIAVTSDSALSPRVVRNAAIDAHPTSGYPAALSAGDFVFIPGMMASARPGEAARNGLADSAQMPDGYLWRSHPIKLETDYVITQKILPALELAGSGPDLICKAQVYLVHGEDYAPFMQVWNCHFGASPCALSIIPCSNPGIGAAAARIEINILALRRDGRTSKKVIDGFTGFEGAPAAVHAGDLLFLSGLMAVDESGLVEAARVDPRQPYLASSVKAQTRAILDRAEGVCRQAGTSLENVVRIQHFHTDLAELLPSLEVWQERLPGQPLPFTAVETPPHVPAPGISLIADLWVYAP